MRLATEALGTDYPAMSKRYPDVGLISPGHERRHGIDRPPLTAIVLGGLQMSAVKDGLSIFEIFEPAQKWIGRLTVFWTAWSVLAKFKSVQDVLDFIQRAAHEINENLGWTADLIVFVLREAARVFHLIADAVFAWLPALNLIPESYHETAIICFMALVPTLFAFARFSGLSSIVESRNEIDRLLLVRRRGHASGLMLQIDRSEQSAREIRNYWVNPAPELYDHREALEHARRFLGAAGFKVFSLRFYMSVLLASALTFEMLYPQNGPSSFTAQIVWVWLGTITAFVVGLYIRRSADNTEQRGGLAFAYSLAKAHSVPAYHSTEGGLRSVLINPQTSDAISHAIAHVLRAPQNKAVITRLRTALKQSNGDWTGGPFQEAMAAAIQFYQAHNRHRFHLIKLVLWSNYQTVDNLNELLSNPHDPPINAFGTNTELPKHEWEWLARSL